MTGDIVDLKNSVPTSTGLVGSFYSGNASHTQTRINQQGHCPVCNAELMPQSKFCGDCGTATVQAQADSVSVVDSESHPNAIHPEKLPGFAQVSQQMRKAIPPEMKKEYRRLTTLLARERFFLLAHYLIFLFVNLLGFSLAVKAYNGIYADEISRTIMALFPLFFINAVALGCLVPIQGTKKEITRLKEKLTYLHYQIEYANL